MHIKCEQCHTTYLLDDKLIPPQGAPVQCTRCGNVFIAKVDGGGAPAQQAPKSTQMFGSPDPAPQAPPTSRTQMFGAPGAPGGPAPATGSQAIPNKTVMFGVTGADPAPQSGPQGRAAQAPANKTMMFGTEGAPGAPAAGAPPPGSRTVMFGAPGAEAPGAGPQGAIPSKTVMFGVDAPAPGGAANRTMMFGAGGTEAPPPPAQPAANPRSTMMFGAAGAGVVPEPQAAANPRSTMMFGAAGAEPPAQGAPPGSAPVNKTMMFGAGGAGAPPDPQAAANPRSTMMFGAVPPANLGAPTGAPPPRTSNTMMFGTPAAGAPPPAQNPSAQKTSSTMMFGTPVAAPPAAQNPQAQKTSSTMMFGTPVAAPPPNASPPGAQKSSSTMIFGATPVVGPGPGKAPKLTEATVRIGPEDLERMMREHEAQRRTDDGAASPDGATPPAGNDSVARQNKTQMFAMGDQPEPVSQSKRPPRAAPPSASNVDSSILDTFPPDAPRPRATPNPEQTLLDAGPEGSDPGPRDSIRQQTSTLVGERVDLPPETPELLGGGDPSTVPNPPTDADPAAVLRAQVARRNRVALILIALVLVGAALGVTWKVFGRMVLSRAPPAAAVEACDKALAVLRFDDSKSKAEAVTQLTTLVNTYPDYVEGHAALVTAVSLQLDDVQQRVRRIEQLVERKNSLIQRYNKDKTPNNWETIAQSLSTQVDELIKEHRPLSDQGHELDARARTAYKGLESAVVRIGDVSKPARLAALRAQALFHGVSGTDQALQLAKRYENTAEGAPPDGWIDLAIPEYAANARVSEELMQQAQGKIDELHKRDSTFLRTYVLSARLHLIKKELEAAAADLDQVLTMRKDHDVAAELREWVRKLPKGEEKKDAPAP